MDNNNKAPFDMNNDYGSATISSGTTVLQKKLFRIAVHMVNQDCVINRCKLQVTSDDSNPFTVAMVKYTPSNSATSAYPVVLYEKSVTAGSSDDKVFTTDLNISSDFTNTSLTAGDHIFLMVKANSGSGVGDDVYIVNTVELGYATN